MPFVEQFVGDYRQRLLCCSRRSALVLLIACGNVANLLLARGAARAREIAVRTALGAGHWRIVRQLLTESVVLALVRRRRRPAASRTGSSRAVVAWSPHGRAAPRAGAHRSAWRSASPSSSRWSAACSAALAPALRVSRRDVQTGLRDGGRGSTGGVRDRLRAGLIVAEVALSLLLLVGAGLLIRSAIALQRTNTGFEPRGVLSARLTLPATSYTEPARIIETLRRIDEAAAADPRRLVGGDHLVSRRWAAAAAPTASSRKDASRSTANFIQSTLRVITPGFFATMGVPIVKGRNFNDGDRADGQRVMIVSDAAGGASLSRGRIRSASGSAAASPARTRLKVIVGVAGDIRSRGPAVAPRPEFYLPIAQAPDVVWSWFRTHVHRRADRRRSGGARQAVERRGHAASIRDLPLFDVRTMDQRLAGSLATARFNTLLLSLLGGIGLVLAATGIYGVIAYFVSQRTQEIGVRIALGATPASVVRLVLGAGDAAGRARHGRSASPRALAASRVLAGQLFGVSRTDPLTIAAVVGHTHRRGARGERRAGAARGGGRSDAGAAVGMSQSGQSRSIDDIDQGAIHAWSSCGSRRVHASPARHSPTTATSRRSSPAMPGMQNPSPALAWKDAPAGTKSFVLIMHDPDAPMAGGFTHWVLFDIPASTTSAARRISRPARSASPATADSAAPATAARVRRPASHHYHFTLSALTSSRWVCRQGADESGRREGDAGTRARDRRPRRPVSHAARNSRWSISRS